jgi:hydroxymethylbilane synthase
MPAVAARTIRLASRKSQLALVQTHWVQGEFQRLYPDRTFEVVTMTTQGDNILDVALAKIGDKGLFTKELELSMLRQDTDFAVHSLKDLPTHLPEGLMLGCITERENPADALVVHPKCKDYQIDTLPAGTVIGTSSLRRLAQLRHHFPHLEFKDVRGNLNTRLQKLDNGEYDALILAYAGLHRLGIECRTNDPEILELLKKIEHTPTAQRCLAERSFLRELEGGCQVPIGVNTTIEGDQLTLMGMVASLDGKRLIKDVAIGGATSAEDLGIQLADKLKAQGAQEILNEIIAEFR